jgi:hypothetical protein
MTLGQAVVLAAAEAELRSGTNAKRTKAPATPAGQPWDKPKAPRRAKATKPREAPLVMDLLFFDPDSMKQIRDVPAWRRVIEEMEPRPTGDEPHAREEAPWRSEDRREVYEVLARAEVMAPRAMETALREARRQEGELVPPLVLLGGEVEPRFDELAALKAAMTMAAMMLKRSGDELHAVMERAERFLQSPSPDSLPEIAEELTAPIRAAIEAHDKKNGTATKRSPQIDRGLAQGRHYQKRTVFGATHIRFLLRLPGEKSARVAYGPEEMGEKLPGVRRFQARLIAEVRRPPDEDQDAGATQALRVLAISRVVDQG